MFISLTAPKRVLRPADGHQARLAFFLYAGAYAILQTIEPAVFGQPRSKEKAKPLSKHLAADFRLLADPTSPSFLLFLFFLTQTEPSQVAIRKEHQADVPMPASPGSAFVVIHPELFLQLLVSVFNPISLMVNADHLHGRLILRHVAEEVSQLFTFSLIVPPFHDEPDLLMEIPFAITHSRPYPQGHSLRNQRLSSTIFTQFKTFPSIRCYLFPQIRNLCWRGMNTFNKRMLSRPASFLFLRRGQFDDRRFEEYLCIGVDPYNIKFLAFIQALPEFRNVPVPTVRNNSPMQSPTSPGHINLLKSYAPLFFVMHFSRHACLFTPNNTIRIIKIVPFFRNKQIHVIRPCYFLTNIGHTDSDLTVIDLSCRSTVLARYAHTFLALLWKAGVVNGENSLWVIGLSKHHLTVFLQDLIFVPLYLCQQSLHTAFRCIHSRRYWLNRLTLPIHHQTNHVALGQLTALLSLKILQKRGHILNDTRKGCVFGHAEILTTTE